MVAWNEGLAVDKRGCRERLIRPSSFGAPAIRVCGRRGGGVMRHSCYE